MNPNNQAPLPSGPPTFANGASVPGTAPAPAPLPEAESKAEPTPTPQASKPPKRPAPPKRVAQRTEVTNIQRKRSGQVVEEHDNTTHVPHEVAIENPRHVHASLSGTKNLGNFESAKVTVGVTLPCENNDLAQDQACDRALEFVTRRVEEELSNH